MMVDIDRLQKQSGIIGTSKKIQQVLKIIAQVAPVDISVLLTGDSGHSASFETDGFGADGGAPRTSKTGYRLPGFITPEIS